MLGLVLLVALCSVCLAVDVRLNSQWDAFKKQHTKVYDPLTDNIRRIVWESNLEIIERHNELADNGLKSYRLGMNEYGDMTNAEFVALMNGYRQNVNRTASEKFVSNGQAAPEEVDWSKKGYVTPVKDQEQCSSCWAFSTTGTVEGQHFKKTGKLVSLSEQNLIDCSRGGGRKGCGGGSVQDDAYNYIMKNGGIDTEASYPYTASDGKCHFKRSGVGATIRGHVDIERDNEEALKRAVAEVGPISVGIDAAHISFQLYKSGVYDEPECSSTALDHGVLAVGYGTKENRNYWLVKNSWGVTWGMNGYIMMSRNKKNQCGIATQASFPIA